MPDESCRTCGGELANHVLCQQCRRSTQKKCKICDHVTSLQPHQYCMKNSLSHTKEPLVQVIHSTTASKIKKNSFHFSYLTLGVIGFFVLGLAVASYLGVSQGVSDEAQATNSSNLGKIPSFPIVSGTSYDNCLAYGSGESITVTCPTDNGSVYKGILNMPQDLKKDFADSVFSIRGVSIMENSDGSVTLQYQLQKYVTEPFGN
ncbi:MAG TPA: hypothetical protein VFX64_06930 [Candidatus Nitrosotalea sp.]|nr:hypothetical protein [Candidatus Nitrosotalea sp.]